MSLVANDKRTDLSVYRVGALGTIVKNELHRADRRVTHDTKQRRIISCCFMKLRGLEAPVSTIVSKAWYLFCKLLPFTLNVVEARR